MASNHNPTRIAILGNEDIIVDFDIWRNFIAEDLLSSLKASTYVLITDQNLYVRSIASSCPPLRLTEVPRTFIFPSSKKLSKSLSQSTMLKPGFLPTRYLLGKAPKAEKRKPKLRIGYCPKDAFETQS